MRAFIVLQILIVIVALGLNAHAERIKDIANVRGVRTNQLVGYGLVVGLAGTGDNKMPFTNTSVGRMLDRLGMKLNNKNLATKNVAAVIVTATLPPFARAGNQIDVTVSSIGDAKSLRGGMLVQTPLRAANQQTYAVAQGSILVGSDSGGVHETVGRIPDGAIIERDLGSDFADRNMFRLTLHNPDFTTAARIVKAINMELGGQYASALDAGTINLITPPSYEGKGVELLATIENLNVSPDMKAEVVVDENTGTVVIGSGVKISPVAISHGNLSIRVGNSAKSKGKGGKMFMLNNSASVGAIVKAMNQMGVSPKDLITILEAIKAAGALQAELKVI